MDERLTILSRGVLLALAELRRGFKAEGDPFQLAYGEGLRACPEYDVARRAGSDFDPVFGVYHEAEAMILHGMHSLILRFDSTYRFAQFGLSAQTAGKELDELPDRVFYRKIAAAMHEALKRR